MVTYCSRWLNGGAAATTMQAVLERSRASREFQKNERAKTGASGKNKWIAHVYLALPDRDGIGTSWLGEVQAVSNISCRSISSDVRSLCYPGTSGKPLSLVHIHAWT